MQHFLEWIKAHKTIAIAFGAIAALLVYKSYKNAQATNQTAPGGSGGLQQTPDYGITQTPGGTTIVPTNPTDASSFAPNYTAPDNTAATLQALSDFQAAQDANSTGGTAQTPAAPPSSGTSSGSSSTGGLFGGLDLGSLLSNMPSGSSGGDIPSGTYSQNPDGSWSFTPAGTSTSKNPNKNGSHGTKGTPNSPTVTKHPANPNGVTHPRAKPVTHPAQGKTSPTGHATTQTTKHATHPVTKKTKKGA